MKEYTKGQNRYLHSVSILHVTVVLLTVAANNGQDNVLSCVEKQFVNLNEKGIIVCKITVPFYGVYWYARKTRRDSIIRLVDGKKTGPDFENGRLDIAENGSLIINNVSLSDERNYRVMVALSAGEEAPTKKTVSVTVVVPSLEKFATIGMCETSECCTFVPHIDQQTYQQSIQCCMTGKPLTLTWYNYTSGSPVEILEREAPLTDNPPFNTCVSTVIDMTGPGMLLMNLTCAPSGRAVKPTTRNASVLVLKESVNDFLDEELFHLNGTLKLGTERNRTGIWTRQTKTSNCHVIASTDVRITTSPDQLVIKECNENDEGLYFFIYKYEGTHSSKTYDVKSVLPPDQAKSYIEGCIFPDNCSITIDQNKLAGNLTCKTSDVRPEPTVRWIPCENQTGIEFTNGEIPPPKLINKTERIYEVAQILRFKFLKASSCNLSCIISNDKWFKEKHISFISLRYYGKDEL